MLTKPVLLVTASTFPRWQGDSEPRFVYDLCIRLAHTFDVLVLTPHAAGTKKSEQWGNLKVFRYRYAPEALETLTYNGGINANLKQSRWKYLLLPTFFLSQWLMMRKLLKQHPVAAIHAHWLIPQGLVAVLATIFTNNSSRPSLLCTSHGGDLFGLQDPISIRLKRWVIKRSDAISVVSTAMVQKVEELVRKTDVNVIPMGTDLETTFVPPTNNLRNRNQLLFAGRLVDKKGIHHLLHALKIVIQALPKTKLIIAGSGPLQYELETLTQSLRLSEYVEFRGRLQHSELAKLYQESALAVFPFVQTKDGDMEGLGLVVVEALGCGCPVIASDLPAVRDVIKHGETGHLVPPGDEKILSQCIIEALNTSETTNAITANTRKQLLQHFDWHSISHAYQQQLQQKITAA